MSRRPDPPRPGSAWHPSGRRTGRVPAAPQPIPRPGGDPDRFSITTGCATVAHRPPTERPRICTRANSSPSISLTKTFGPRSDRGRAGRLPEPAGRARTLTGLPAADDTVTNSTRTRFRQGRRFLESSAGVTFRVGADPNLNPLFEVVVTTPLRVHDRRGVPTGGKGPGLGCSGRSRVGQGVRLSDNAVYANGGKCRSKWTTQPDVWRFGAAGFRHPDLPR